MHPTCTRSFASNGIEVACSALTLHNATNMQIVVLYRSPIVPLQALTAMLTGVSLRMVRGNLVMTGSIGWKIKHDMETTLATDRML